VKPPQVFIETAPRSRAIGQRFHDCSPEPSESVRFVRHSQQETFPFWYVPCGLGELHCAHPPVRLAGGGLAKGWQPSLFIAAISLSTRTNAHTIGRLRRTRDLRQRFLGQLFAWKTVAIRNRERPGVRIRLWALLPTESFR
jgi:hypothetical protein